MPDDPFLQKLERAGKLSDEERVELQVLIKGRRTVLARDDIAISGSSDRVYLVTGGFACRYKTLQNGNRRIVSFVLPGDLCFMHDTGAFGRDLRVGALTPCTVADLARSRLIELIARYPGISRAIWWVTLRELSRAREWIVNDARPANQRLAHTLCELFVCLQVIGLADEHSFGLPISQTDLGDALGVSAVHVNRVLQALRAEGLITWTNHRVTIPDVESLKELAEFEPSYLCFDGYGP
ncbi:Crp/Fnr family transcriptional regulator [Methylobacterium gregans]|uniref:Nitrogen fixation regulation protein FixK n=1 Tax=Methylobacterium gregans TaxID=374424 RepID=A0AA37HLE1_9HYPH|nr:Crp/Fnr family transcriptional regulator [Methylobacterium gregans]MDQ0520040.1 CRP-like cAMP-binding protein [Methylobacterium gregans]GJD77017.1 Nitrogen fixation regulation protein FixK [Methylobacterium gregans]GLS52440.1 transcriptional regulator [Methylobacterium gregans]